MKKDVTHRDDLSIDCEIIWTQIQNNESKSLFLASFYRLNMNDMHSLQEFDSSLFEVGDRLNSNNVIVAGDHTILNSKLLLYLVNHHWANLFHILLF